MGDNDGGAQNWRDRGDWGSSNGGRASDNERGGCGLAVLVLLASAGLMSALLVAGGVWLVRAVS